MNEENVMFVVSVACVWWGTWCYLKHRRRDRFAAAALAGLLADHLDHADECKEGETCPEAVACLAVEHADAVIKRLNQTP